MLKDWRGCPFLSSFTRVAKSHKAGMPYEPSASEDACAPILYSCGRRT